MRLNLFRHGQSYVNSPDWQSVPNLDAGLTERGHQQAAALRDWLKANDTKADVLYSSTMQRTRETAQYVAEALNLSPIYDDRLRELGSVYATGEPIEAENLPRSYIEHTPKTHPFTPFSDDIKKAENWMQGRARLGHFVDELTQKHTEETVYVVAHGGVIAAIFANVFNTGPYRHCDVHNYQTSSTLLEYRPEHKGENWYLRHHNRIDHLIGTSLIQG